MQRHAPILVVLPFLVGAAPSPSCESISDNEARILCRAISAHDQATCSALRSSQSVRSCVAAISGRAADAEAVDDPTLRAYLRAMSH